MGSCKIPVWNVMRGKCLARFSFGVGRGCDIHIRRTTHTGPTVRHLACTGMKPGAEMKQDRLVSKSEEGTETKRLGLKNEGTRQLEAALGE